MKKLLTKWVLKKIYQYGFLEFKTWKSPTHLEQYTSISFMGEEIERIVWSEVEKICTKLD